MKELIPRNSSPISKEELRLKRELFSGSLAKKYLFGKKLSKIDFFQTSSNFREMVPIELGPAWRGCFVLKTVSLHHTRFLRKSIFYLKNRPESSFSAYGLPGVKTSFFNPQIDFFQSSSYFQEMFSTKSGPPWECCFSSKRFYHTTRIF